MLISGDGTAKLTGFGGSLLEGDTPNDNIVFQFSPRWGVSLSVIGILRCLIGEYMIRHRRDFMTVSAGGRVLRQMCGHWRW